MLKKKLEHDSRPYYGQHLQQHLTFPGDGQTTETSSQPPADPERIHYKVTNTNLLNILFSSSLNVHN